MSDERTAMIESRIDTERSASIAASNEIGGIRLENMAQVFELAKMMSVSGPAVPTYMRANPGACLAICLQALEWRMSPFAVANKSYMVENKGEQRIAFESQLVHAIVEARAPLKGRLKVSYEGEGDDRRCIISGHFKGEDEPSIFRSETLKKRRPGKNDYGKTKGSPLWDTKPDLQQFYDASRDWARQYCPDVIMGVYSEDEFDEMPKIGPDAAKDITPSGSLVERLKATPTPTAGFDPSHIEKTLGGEVVEAQSSTNDGAILPASSAVPDDSTSSPVASGTAPTSPELPPPPKDGKDYPEYAKAMMATLPTPEAIAAWWKSKNERSLRNSLANLGQPELTLIDEYRASRLAEIQPK